MNNKGQSLILFVLLLPVFILLFAYVFDTALILSNDHKLQKIGEEVIYAMYEDVSIRDLEKLINKNDQEIKIEKLNLDEKRVHLKKDIDSFFGKIIGFKTYHLDTSLKGTLKNGQVIIEKKG